MLSPRHSNQQILKSVVLHQIFILEEYMETPGEDIYDIGRLGKNKILYYDNENIIKQPLTLFK